MNCAACGQDYLRCNCESQQPYCEQCGEDNKCNYEMDALCVIYHPYDDSPSLLHNLGMPNGSNLEDILEAIDALLAAGVPLTVVDSTSIDFSTSGAAGHTLTGSVIISPDLLNQLEIRANGLYAKPFNPNYLVKVDSTDVPDYLVNQIIGGSDGVIGISVVNTAGLLSIVPSINLDFLIADLCSQEDFADCIEGHETPITVVDTDSVDLTASGTNNHTIQADVKISATVGNTIVINPDGIYSTGGALNDAINGLYVDGTDVKLGGDLVEDTEVTDVDFNMKFRTNVFLLGNLTDVTTFTQPGGYANGANRVLEGFHKVDLIGGTAIPFNWVSGFVYATGLDESTHQFHGASVTTQFHFTDAMTFGAQTQDAAFAATCAISGDNFTSVTTTYPVTAFQAGVYINDPAYIGESDSATPGVIVDVAHYSIIPINNEPGQSLSDSPTITNLIGLNIEDFSSGSAIGNVTNKFAILQKGATDVSRFFGPVQNAASAVQFTSDARVKENISEYTRGLAEIDAIDVKSFNYVYNKDRNVVGVIAQELEKILPEAVEQTHFETPNKSQSFTDFRMVDQNRLFYTMLNAIKELSAKVKALENN